MSLWDCHLRRGPLTDLDRVSKRILELAKLYGLKIDPDAYVWQLSVGQQQRVEIIKALYRGAALLILDEPTAVLTPQEVDELFVIMHQMVKDGHALIFISHKLHEVVEISNRVTVLRDGRKIGTRPTSETTKADPCQLDGRTRNWLRAGAWQRGTRRMPPATRACLLRQRPRHARACAASAWRSIRRDPRHRGRFGQWSTRIGGSDHRSAKDHSRRVAIWKGRMSRALPPAT